MIDSLQCKTTGRMPTKIILIRISLSWYEVNSDQRASKKQQKTISFYKQNFFDFSVSKKDSAANAFGYS